MIPGLTSVVIPTHNHAAYLEDAVLSALAQSVPVQIVVVDDGSTDDTSTVLGRLQRDILPSFPKASLLPILSSHRGAPHARNLGIEATEGEFVQFLDADDLIDPRKLEKQIAAMDPDIGWVVCDTLIQDAPRNRTELASERYRYRQRNLGGWIREQLAASNFIPIHAPLVRRSVLTEEVRFGDLLPEDWHFWYRVAGHARMRYLPEVLATYRKRREGRNASRWGVAHVSPASVGDGPLLLNLGCGTPGSPSWHPMPGSVNLDRSMGWMFEDGLPHYTAGSVAGITISHALMYVDLRDWPAVFTEFARVLAPGGVVRITEDETEDQASSRLGGWRGSEPAVTLTTPLLVAKHLHRAGLEAVSCAATTTRYRDRALLQAQHGVPPDVFFIEGVKP